MAASSTFVIAGASLAGASAAEELRTQGFDGRVILIGAEAERPYERPKLSKEHLRGEVGRDALYVHDEDFYAEHGIELRLRTTVTGIDTQESRVELDSGERVAFDRLLVATGARVRALPVPGTDLEGVFYLRSADDAEALHKRLSSGGRLVVVGGGWIGTEVAASARQLGMDVVLLSRTAEPLERTLGATVGAVVGDVHRDHGVTVVGNADVVALRGGDAVGRIRIADGTDYDCDVVAIGVGVTPNTEVTAGSGLDVRDGVVVDEHLLTAVPRIAAAGDVACVWHPRLGRRLRVEHWDGALHQGPAAARSLLHGPVAAAPYTRIPFVSSEQYTTGMELYGDTARADRVLLRGDLAAGELAAFWLAGGRVAAGMRLTSDRTRSWRAAGGGPGGPLENASAEGMALEALIGTAVDPARLADSAVPLTDLAAPPAGRGR